MTAFAVQFLEEAKQILGALDPIRVEALVSGLAEVRARGGRLFILGVGGSAGHASHAVNDFRKLCAFEANCDNASELTAHATVRVEDNVLTP